MSDEAAVAVRPRCAARVHDEIFPDAGTARANRTAPGGDVTSARPRRVRPVKVTRAAGAPALLREASFHVTVFARASSDLPDRCFAAVARTGLRIRSLSIMWDERRPGRRRVEFVTRPCAHDRALALAEELNAGESATIEIA